MNRALAFTLAVVASLWAALPAFLEARALRACDAECVVMMGEK